ncbi:hypothetical protein B296_00008248 [Ensete ventricosum]|uniref:Uncharacterized protein n=1 Tax=Ensete ventricosum TaxID=4639 RepID=A0A426YYZ0_ENSVE|nr:hypothetical protein B296_00008248 [Ensete ventricosum]
MMVESTLKHDRIAAKASAAPESAGAAPPRPNETQNERRWKTYDLLEKQSGEQKGGLKVVSNNAVGTEDDRYNQQCNHGKSSERLHRNRSDNDDWKLGKKVRRVLTARVGGNRGRHVWEGWGSSMGIEYSSKMAEEEGGDGNDQKDSDGNSRWLTGRGYAAA